MKIAYVCDRCGSTVIAAMGKDAPPDGSRCLYSGRRCPGTLRREPRQINQQLRASHRCRRGRLEPWNRHVPESAQAGVGAAFGKFWKETMDSVKDQPK